MLLNVPKFVETHVPLEKRAAMQNWLNTWLPLKEVAVSGLTSTMAIALSSSPVLYYSGVMASMLSVSGIMKAWELRGQKNNNSQHPWVDLADRVEENMPAWYPNPQMHRRDAIVMLSELLRVTWEKDLPSTPQSQLSSSFKFEVPVKVSGESTQLPSHNTIAMYQRDFELTDLQFERLLTTCYLHAAYEHVRTYPYPTQSLEDTLINELNKYAESIWIGRSFSSFVKKYSSAWEQTKWPAAVKMAVEMDILKPQLMGYVQFKLLENMADMHTKAIDLPVLDDMDLSSGSPF